MAKEIDVKISNFDEAISLLKEELANAEKLAEQASRLSFGACKVSRSTGKSARTMENFTGIKLCKIITDYKTLLTKTTELLADAKKKYSNMDDSLAKEISK